MNVVALAGAVALVVPAAGAAAATAAAPVVTAAPVAVPAVPAAVGILVFSKTAGFRHDSIPAGIAAIRELGAQNGFTVDATEDAAVFNDANLARYQAVVWLSTTGDVLDANQQAAFERYIRAGGGYAGIHAAADTEYGWAWYGNLVGAYFASHPAIQQASVKVEDPAHPSTAGLPPRWSRLDEWYNFRTNPRGSAHVLASLDETSYAPGTGAMGHDHPTAWCKDYDGGRAWYTGGGHTIESFADPQFRAHLLGGIRTAAGVAGADCGASLTSRFEKVTLDSNTNNPMELDIAPDGRVFYLERDGRLRIIKPDTRTTVTAGTLSVFTGNEDGLLGLVLDPNFATNRWLYVYYSPAAGAARNQVSRFTVNGDTLDPASERVLLQVGTQRNTCCHTGGAMTFDGAGNLYLATGDNTNPFESSGYTPIDERAGRQTTARTPVPPTRTAAPATPSSGTSSPSPATTAGRTASATTTPTATSRSRPARAVRRSTAPRRSTTRPTTPGAPPCRPPYRPQWTTTTTGTRGFPRSAAVGRRWAGRCTATTRRCRPTASGRPTSTARRCSASGTSPGCTRCNWPPTVGPLWTSTSCWPG
jgi:type 1 glutamine amidotransferase